MIASKPPAGSGVKATTRMFSEVMWLAMSLMESPANHLHGLLSAPVFEIMITANTRCPLSIYGRSAVSRALFWFRKLFTWLGDTPKYHHQARAWVPVLGTMITA